MCLSFNELGIFKYIKKKKPINYEDVHIKFKAWKEKIYYTNSQCAEVLNISVPTIKRLALSIIIY